jgi:predicted ester cyclase
MSRTISSLALIAALGACSAPNADTSTRSPAMATLDSEKNKQTVRRLYEEYINQAQRQVLPELVAPDYVGPDGGRGPSGFATTIDGLRRGVPDIRFKVEDLIAEGDRVTIRWTWSGKHTGVLNGLPPSNRHVENDGIAIYELRDGKVARAWLQTDRLGFLQQIGAVPATLGRRPSN